MKKIYLLIFLCFAFIAPAISQITNSYTTASTFTWVCPPGITSVQVEARGGGGAGGGVNTTGVNRAGGGGGGGAYAKSSVAVTPGNSYTIIVGAGGTGVSAANGNAGGNSSFNTTSIVAAGGAGGLGHTAAASTAMAGGAAGLASASTGATKFDGGSGGTSLVAPTSGGGGGGAGDAANGGNASGSTAGSGGNIGGGAGAAGTSTNGAGSNGTAPGGGGSGGKAGSGSTTARAGGIGGSGSVLLTYSGGYCSPVSTSSATYISNFSTTGASANINKSSTFSAGGYVDYYSSDAMAITAGASFSASVTAVGTTVGIAIFADFNNNQVFDASEKLYSTTGYQGADNIAYSLGSITVPGATAPGTYRMRVVIDYNNTTPVACTFTSGRGEIEDYKLTVNAALLPTITSLGTTTGCASSTMVINGTNLTGATVSGTTIGGTPVASITSNTGSVLTVVVPSAAVSGAVSVTTGGGTATGPSYSVIVPSNPAPPTSNSPQCLSVTLTGATPPAGEVYYWQTSASGTTINSGVNDQSTFSVTTTGTYYLRSQNTTAGCWSPGASSLAVTVNNVPAAAGTPSPANAATGICYAGTGSITSVSWATVSAATSYDVYFGAGTLPGSVTSNVATASYTTGTLLANTTYHWKVIPKNACGVAAAPIEWTFTTSNTPCYCASSGLSSPTDGISGVSFAGMSNISTGLSTYTDYSATKIATVYAGSTYSGTAGLTVNVNTGGNYTNYQTAYIDWNRNGLFSDAGESYSLGTAVNVANGASSLAPLTISVPPGASLGSTKMRIQSKYSAATGDPCATAFDGETEDYGIVVSALVPPAITNITGSGCAGSTITITGTDLSAATSVKIGGTPVASITSNTATQIVAVIGSGTTGIVSITTAGGTGSSATSFTVSPLPAAVTVSGAGSFCGNTTITATNGNDGTIYFQGTTSNGISAVTASVSQVVNASGSYYFRAQSAAGCWGTQGSAVVTINPLPVAPTVTPTIANTICLGSPQGLIASPSAPSASILTQNFNSGLGTWTVSNGTGHTAGTEWLVKTPPYTYSTSITNWNGFDNSNFIIATSDISGSSSNLTVTRLVSPVFSTSGYSSINIGFKHFFRALSETFAGVEFTTNGGSTWTAVTGGTYTGTSTTNAANNPPSISTASLTLNAAAVGQSAVQIRFRYDASYDWYWGIDDIAITGTPISNNFKWTAVPVAGAGLPGGANISSAANNSISATPTAAGTYTYAAIRVDAVTGCESAPVQTGAITVNPNYTVTASSTANGTISPNGATTLSCDGTGDQTYTITPSGGYIISDVLVDNASVGPVGTYTFTDVNVNHTISATFVIPCTNVSIISATASPVGPLCSGQTTTLSANGVAGTNAVVTWYTGPNATGQNLGTGLTLNNVGANTYYAQVTGDCGTPAEASVTVNSIANIFTGAGNWTDNARWSCGAPPSSGDAVVIAAGANATLNTNFIVSGSLLMNATSALVVNPANTLSVDVNATANFNGQSVTFASNASGTASLGEVSGTLSGASNVTVERYIPDNGFRSWRLLSVPVTTTQTIRQAWQEGDANPNAKDNNLPNRGTQITGVFNTQAAAAAAGFDSTSVNAAMLSWNGVSWSNVVTTNQPITNNKSWFLYIRGERSLSVTGAIINSSATTLRAKGTVFTGDQANSIGANAFALVPNLYPSAINFTGLARTGGVSNLFYIWDSKKLSGNSLGVYQTFSGTNSFNCLVGGGSYVLGQPNTIIESGQSFFVTSGAAGTITLKESAKVSGTNGSLGFRPAGTPSKISTRLYNASNEMLDANEAVFSASYTKAVAGEDAPKLGNPGANFAIETGGKLLAVEGTQPVKEGDAIQFRVWNITAGTYSLEIEAQRLSLPEGVTAMLEDSYLKASTAISLAAANKIAFTVNGDAKSSAANRFRIVFAKAAAIAISTRSSYSIAPNPIENNKVNLQLNNQPEGKYRVRIVGAGGQAVYSGTISHAGGTAAQSISLPAGLAAGTYTVEIVAPGKTRSTQTVLVNRK